MKIRLNWLAAAVAACISLAACQRPVPPAHVIRPAGTASFQAVSDGADLTKWDLMSVDQKQTTVMALVGNGAFDGRSSKYLADVLECAKIRRAALDGKTDVATLIGYCHYDLHEAQSLRPGVAGLRFGNGAEWMVAKATDRSSVLSEYFFMTIAMSALPGGKAPETTVDHISACVTSTAGKPSGRLLAIVDMVNRCESPLV